MEERRKKKVIMLFKKMLFVVGWTRVSKIKKLYLLKREKKKIKNTLVK